MGAGYETPYRAHSDARFREVLHVARLRSPLLVIASLSLLVACGSDSEESQPQTQAGQVNTQTAKSAAEGTVQAALTAVNDQNGRVAASQLQAVSSQTQGIITPAAPSTGTTAARILGALGPDLGTLADEGCNCTETSCTFQDCGSETSKISGTLSWEGGHLECDLQFKTIGAGLTGEVDITTSCDLKVTESSLDGTLGTKGTVSNIPTADNSTGAIGSYEWNVSTRFDKVAYDAQRKPISGSVHVEGTYTIFGQVYSGSADVTFP